MSQHLKFTRPQRLGLIILFSGILLLQIAIVCIDFEPQELGHDQSWLALQPKIDSMKTAKSVRKTKMYPFNPNFITDYRGHVLGMSVAEIDRLHAFRERGKFVNSAAEFQGVTKISDSLLAVIKPYFKFPDWVNKRNAGFAKSFKSEAKKQIDINTASKEELMKVYGIGDKLSDRILEMRDKLGGFASMQQMADVWGLSPEVVEKLNEGFKIVTVPTFKKIAVNQASVKELGQFPYFRYALARKIITARSMNGNFKNLDDLSKVDGFPVEKLDIIAVYLEF